MKNTHNHPSEKEKKQEITITRLKWVEESPVLEFTDSCNCFIAAKSSSSRACNSIEIP